MSGLSPQSITNWFHAACLVSPRLYELVTPCPLPEAPKPETERASSPETPAISIPDEFRHHGKRVRVTQSIGKRVWTEDFTVSRTLQGLNGSDIWEVQTEDGAVRLPSSAVVTLLED